MNKFKEIIQDIHAFVGIIAYFTSALYLLLVPICLIVNPNNVINNNGLFIAILAISIINQFGKNKN